MGWTAALAGVGQGYVVESGSIYAHKIEVEDVEETHQDVETRKFREIKHDLRSAVVCTCLEECGVV